MIKLYYIANSSHARAVSESGKVFAKSHGAGRRLGKGNTIYGNLPLETIPIILNPWDRKDNHTVGRFGEQPASF